jgi:prepilin-type N-terminal cleavage/methylation domain-containing protein
MPVVRSHIVAQQPALTRGFSLVELLVVVMIILVIAAIAIPTLMHARMQANEAAAITSMNTIRTAEILYASEFPEIGFSADLKSLGANGGSCEVTTSTSSCIIMDEALTSGFKSGYEFAFLSDGKRPSSDYTLSADPLSAGTSGRCGFSSNGSGEIIQKNTSGGIAGRLSAGSSGCQ